MRLRAHIDVDAPPAAVWAFVDDPARHLHFMSGITRWEVLGEQPTGIGARYRMLMHVGTAEVGGVVEVVEHVRERDLAWTAVVGLDQRGRWRLRERPPARTGLPRTRVELQLSYGVAGAGVSGWVAERVAAPAVRGHLRRSLAQLKRQVEHETLRAAAAQRRAARTA
jgi:uncharacterized membrane protein